MVLNLSAGKRAELIVRKLRLVPTPNFELGLRHKKIKVLHNYQNYIELGYGKLQFFFFLKRWKKYLTLRQWTLVSRVKTDCDGTHAETRFVLSAKRTSPFISAGVSVQSAAGSRGVHISGSNAGYNVFRYSARLLTTHSIRLFPLHFSSRASPCAIRFRFHSTNPYL